MNRRSFLQFIGAFAAGTAIPGLTHEKIARVTQPWAIGKPVAVYRVAKPLEAGAWTFTASCTVRGEYMGVAFMGVKAEGGETLFEVSCADGTKYTNYGLSRGVGIGLSDMKATFIEPQEITQA